MCMRPFATAIAALFIAGVLGISIFAAMDEPDIASALLPRAALKRPNVHVLFIGDMMFDRSVRGVMNERGGDFIFSCIKPVLDGADVVVGNLEGPITARSSRSIGTIPGDGDNYIFTFPVATADLLARHNVRMVNLGNNHILNFGSAGVASTTELLTKAGVGYFGDPLRESVAAGRFGGVPLAFVGYNEFDTEIGAARAASTTLAHIAAARADGYVPIVYTHWGQEYATSSSLAQQTLAHRFVDAGAEIVIGSHPHVVQEHEFYKGKYIYYSLGNFIFDQYWNADVSHGLLLEIELTGSGVAWVREIFVELGRDRRTCPIAHTATISNTADSVR